MVAKRTANATSSWFSATLSLVLEHIDVPALVVDEVGTIECSNHLARVQIDGDDGRSRTKIVRALKRGEGNYVVHALDGPGGTRYLLVMRRPMNGARASDRVEAARRRYRLTNAQGRVLHHLVKGAANRVIAAHLNISERTVEAHVSAMLAKLDVDSRGALVALVLTG